MSNDYSCTFKLGFKYIVVYVVEDSKSKWSNILTIWALLIGMRGRRRLAMRWEDDLIYLFDPNWRVKAKDSKLRSDSIATHTLFKVTEGAVE